MKVNWESKKKNSGANKQTFMRVNFIENFFLNVIIVKMMKGNWNFFHLEKTGLCLAGSLSVINCKGKLSLETCRTEENIIVNNPIGRKFLIIFFSLPDPFQR